MITIAINVILYNTNGNNKVSGEQQTNTFVCSGKQISTKPALLYGQQESCIILITSLSCF